VTVSDERLGYLDLTEIFPSAEQRHKEKGPSGVLPDGPFLS
jgi:hypothetical protein